MRVRLIIPGTEDFSAALEALYGRPVNDVLRPALPYSVIAFNEAERAVALLGIRFDMAGGRGKPCAVVHYADTLRYPERAAIQPGVSRFFCAEPGYTALVLRQEATVSRRTQMNLENLGKFTKIEPAVDCVAFDDGTFEGPDSRGVFERFADERGAESAFADEIINKISVMENILAQGLRNTRCQTLAQRWLQGFAEGGEAEVIFLARAHRLRIPLSRKS